MFGTVIYMRGFVVEWLRAVSLSNKPLFMELNQIKNAHILDILFDGRNKEYGAYELRKTYNRRMVKAMIVTGSVVVMVIVSGVVMGGARRGRVMAAPTVTDFTLDNVKEPPALKPPPPPKPVQPQVAMIRITTVRIVPDDQVKKNEAPPENDAANDMKIGPVTQDGIKDDGITAPPVSDVGKCVVEAPKKGDDGGGFIPIEKEAEFPGGLQAWARFLNKTLTYPEDALNIGVQGTVMVQFVVDVDGTVSEVKAISGPETGGLREEAVRVIKKSGKWTPALQNGRFVKAYRRQPVTFKPEGEN